MIDEADSHDEAERGDALLRLITLITGSTEIIAFLLFAHLMLLSSDPLGSAIGEGMTALIAAPVLLLTVPGLLLAWLDRAPKVALAQVMLAIPTAAICWAMA
jgi:hypothetical protein